ncbi:hypothetical protein BD779DRAFT_1479158 [Infundibulicybe gibba]|nr:hypothetical protein BD779DRAFT_1479158 [Infundibulicybe gibba]
MSNDARITSNPPRVCTYAVSDPGSQMTPRYLALALPTCTKESGLQTGHNRQIANGRSRAMNQTPTRPSQTSERINLHTHAPADGQLSVHPPFSTLTAVFATSFGLRNNVARLNGVRTVVCAATMDI